MKKDKCRKPKHSKKAGNESRKEIFFKKELSKGKTAQQILKVPHKDLEEVYSAAKIFFEKEKYVDSLNAYQYLVTLNPRKSEYWLGLAMSLQRCGDYEAALDSYEMAFLGEVSDPVAYYFLAECLLAVQDITNAILALDLVVELSSDYREYADLKSEAMTAKDVLLGLA